QVDAFIGPSLPDIGERRDFEFLRARMFEKCREKCFTKAIGKSDDARAHDIVRAQNVRIAVGRKRTSASRRSAELEKIPARRMFRHGLDLAGFISARLPSSPIPFRHPCFPL